MRPTLYHSCSHYCSQFFRSWRSNEWSAQSSPRTPQQSSKQGGLVSSGHSWGTPTPTIFQWDQNHKPDDFNGPNYPGFESCGNQCLPRAERWRHGDPLLGLELKCLSPVLTRVVLKSLQLKIRYCNPCLDFVKCRNSFACSTLFRSA